MKVNEFEKQLHEHAARVKNSMAAPFDHETEELAMTKNNTRASKMKISLIAIAAVFLLGTTAFAAGFGGWFSYSEKEYTSLPAEQEYVKDVGYAPVLIQEFENGYSYKTGYVMDNEHTDSKTAVTEKFKSSVFEYEKAGDLVFFSQDKFEAAQCSGTVVENFNGVDLYYKSYMNKIVPVDYQMTEADKEAEARGDLVFSWGSDEVYTVEVKSLMWIEDDIQYCLVQTGGMLTEDDMCSMAKEAIEK